MKFKKLFVALMAAAVAFVSCEQDEDLGRASIQVSPNELSFQQGDGTESIMLTATRDWMAISLPDWVAISKTEGKASLKSQKLIISVDANSGYDRIGNVVFSIGFAEKQTVVISQKGAKGELSKGSGTLADPYTVAGVIEYVKKLGADVESPAGIYVKGKISAVGTKFGDSGNYGNATFDMVDEGGTEVFKAFQTYYLGNRKWKSGDTEVQVGDEVIICGKVYNYKGNTPETVGKGASFIYSLNGKTEGGGTSGGGGETGEPKGTGTQADPFNVAAAIKAVSGLTWTANDNYDKVGPYYVKGKVAEVKDAFSAQYGNCTFTMVDEGSDAVFTAYRVIYLGNRKWQAGDSSLSVGDEVIIYAELMNYRGNTPETSGGYLYSLNGKTEGGQGGNDNPGGNTGEPKGSGTLEDPYNPAAAIAAVSNLTWTSNTEYDKTDKVYVKGIISKIANKGTFTESGDYGNASFYISEDGKQENEFYIFRTLYFNGEKYTSGQDIKVGDEVVIYGALMNYQGKTPETVANESYLYSLKEGEGGSQGGNDNPGGEVDASQFVSNVTWEKGSSCYDDNQLNVNGTENVANLKFGTSSKYGDATVTLPAGTTEVVFFAIGWKGADASLKFTAGSNSYSVDVKGNDGASNKAPYNVTVTSSDRYSIKLDSALASETTVTVETYAGNNKGYRAFLFGVQAKK